jgi:hypothetical protein
LIIVTLSGEGESVNDDTRLNGSDKTSLPSWGAGWNQWQKGRVAAKACGRCGFLIWHAAMAAPNVDGGETPE